MRIALDTNRYTDLARGDSAVRFIVETAEEVFLPLPALAELRVGFLGGTKARENEKSLLEFLNTRGTSILYPDEATTSHYASVIVHLRRQGTPIPINDVWIAALVLQHGLTLCARDKHFDHLPQIMRI